MDLQLVFSCLSYLVALSFFWLYLRKLSYSFLRYGRWFLGVGVALHWGFLISWFINAKIFVPSNSLESALSVLALAGLISWLLSTQKALIFIMTFTLPLICGGLLVFEFAAIVPQSVSLPNPWLWTHIVLAVLADTFFFFAALISLGYLIMEFQLKRRQAATFFSRLPSLAEFDVILGEALLAGFVLSTLGLLLGLLFAEKYWIGIWILDPKILFSFLVWVLYAALLFLRKLFPAYRGRKSALVALLGCFAILIVSLCMPSARHNALPPSEVEKIEK
jgi:ABC-type uncharacterized transport system permease subunit